jgi:hypothetical protein
MNKRLGVDVGGVLIDRVNDNTDTSFFGKNFLATNAVPGAFTTLKALRAKGWEIHLVSKCGEQVQQKTRLWLAHHRFFEETGIPSSNLHFCLTRPAKAPICTQLSITHFVDDRLDVLDCLRDVSGLFLFQPNSKDRQRHGRERGRALQVESWAEVAQALDLVPQAQFTAA